MSMFRSIAKLQNNNTYYSEINTIIITVSIKKKCMVLQLPSDLKYLCTILMHITR